MSYPKWRHHPEFESVIVDNEDFEASMAPDSDGWRDDRDFPEDIEGEDKPKRRGRKPKEQVEE